METNQVPQFRTLSNTDSLMLISILVKKLGGAVLITDEDIARESNSPFLATHSHRRGMVLETVEDE